MDLLSSPRENGGVRPLAGEALLAAWERGGNQSPIGRALALLAAGFPDMTEAEALALNLPQRDLALLHLRGSNFGHSLSGFCVCSGCGERLEFVLSDEALIATLQDAAATECTLTEIGCTLRLRLANSSDVAAAASAADLDAARGLLLARCVAAVGDAENRPVPLAALPEETRRKALARLQNLHEAGELSVSLNCPGCGANEAVFLDVAGFFWAEVLHAARLLLDDVHELAWTYGWSEAAILAMSPARRRAYLERLRS